MKNYLILVCECKVFRRSPLLRIFINDRFLDEFQLENKFADNNDIEEEYLDPNLASRSRARHMENLYFVKLYEFSNISNLCHVKIECFNDDTNYTNGFMNKSTLIKFRYIFLVSASNTHIFEKINQQYAYSLHNFEKFYEIKKYYTDKIANNYLWENFGNVATFKYPNNKDADLSFGSWVGGSGTLQFTAKKHMGIWRDVNRKPGVCRLGWVHVIKKILNKYLHNEN